ncbi:thiamine-phosphate kinase [Oleiagrimonas soli]|uniref:Thiamine-monophosphate kinase n=1 Tax=Oleiagrimonas soli TaxID=1543381 RepID=A0A099CYB5_9GAMM|nr:thiamine-phosphate kinase [Oleiagrimonas soli]KGI78577.1 thiamine-monophosphate kinase [Oleiagrimonas soli]MBB6184135.1 thiamine-monophosphate kinase [Oleiagrimonas soli]
MEFDLIEAIRARSATRREDVLLGIGDDAALLRPPPGHALAVAVDTLLEGVHFPLGTAPADIGWKALAVNLSDLAAMGATPAWALLSLSLPRADRRFVEGFLDGFMALAEPHRLALVGGDTTRGTLAVSVTVHGFVHEEQALRRSGAKPGDAIFVTGTLGDAAAGLACLDRQRDDADRLLTSAVDSRKALIERLNRPSPRVAAGQWLREVASACIDVSDGLLADLGHLCKASGVGASLDVDALPLSSALLTLFADNARDFALTGGDDYELCFTAAPEHAARIVADLARQGCGAARIGRIVAEEGVALHDADGRRVTASASGWDHFRT